MVLLEKLSENMRRLRKEKGLSQEELAARCDLHRTYISLVERKQRTPTLDAIEIIAAGLGVSPFDLFK